MNFTTFVLDRNKHFWVTNYSALQIKHEKTGRTNILFFFITRGTKRVLFSQGTQQSRMTYC